MDTITIVLFCIGLVLLVVGADLLVRGASTIAKKLGISSLVVGLTVVAFGTSAPELAVSVTSAIAGDDTVELALGNVIGSNLFNILMILGVSSIVAPLLVERQLVRLDVPVMIGASALCLLMALDGGIGFLDGIILFSGLLIYTYTLIRSTRKHPEAPVEPEGDAPEQPDKPDQPVNMPKQLGLVAAGLVMLVVGSGWLVDGAVAFATMFGVSELVIGLTVVAVGTSLPELATSVIAVARGERDIAVGNAIGSSIFNILMVLGLTAVFSPVEVPVSPGVLAFDLPVMLAIGVACLPPFITGNVIARWEGAVFVAYYLAYT
ncbi:MAG: calcium/sodium antiporter, partial [Nannocystaceae bacterium]